MTILRWCIKSRCPLQSRSICQPYYRRSHRSCIVCGETRSSNRTNWTTLDTDALSTQPDATPLSSASPSRGAECTPGAKSASELVRTVRQHYAHLQIAVDPLLAAPYLLLVLHKRQHSPHAGASIRLGTPASICGHRRFGRAQPTQGAGRLPTGTHWAPPFWRVNRVWTW